MASRVVSDVTMPTLTLKPEPGTHQENSTTVRLRLKKPKTRKKVGWSEETVDNEEMNKKKSKCCCIYKKPLAYGESSSESEDECDNCPGHTTNHRKDNEPNLPSPSIPPIG